MAPADGFLFRAKDDKVNSASANSAWDKFHTFYILHDNGMSTWYLHVDELDVKINSLLPPELNDKPIWVKAGQRLGSPGDFGLESYCSNGCEHLHFEVRNGLHDVIDPYKDCLWYACSARRSLPPIISLLLDHDNEKYFNGEWYSPAYNYSFLINGNIGVATLSNSSKIEVGDVILKISQFSDNSFTALQMFTDGNWYSVLGVIGSDGVLKMQGGGFSWEMIKNN